jgi:hypothetical protein
MIERKLETKMVKAALKAAGINATVKHGTGTAWGWIEINVGSSKQFPGHVLEQNGQHVYGRCPACTKIQAIAAKAQAITMKVTGRHGDYHGNTQVLTQTDWNEARRQSFEIVQDPDVAEKILAEYRQDPYFSSLVV